MTDGWKYFDLSIDIRTTRLTPIDEELQSSESVPTKLISENCLSRSAAAFIYRFDSAPTELLETIKDQDRVIRSEEFGEDAKYFDLFVHAEMEDGYLLYDLVRDNPIIVKMPIEYTGTARANIRIMGPDTILMNTFAAFEKRSGISIKKVGYCRPTVEDPLEILTGRQKDILKSAIREGYYEIPRETSLKALSKFFDISPQTVGEHLRKVESRVLKSAKIGGNETPMSATPNELSGGASD